MSSRRGALPCGLRTCALVIGVCALAVLAGGGAAAPSGGESAPLTLLATKGPIYALAKDGDRLAWVEGRREPPCDNGGHAANLKTSLFGGAPRHLAAPPGVRQGIGTRPPTCRRVRERPNGSAGSLRRTLDAGECHRVPRGSRDHAARGRPFSAGRRA